MTSKKTGKDMPLFLITMDKSEENKAAYHVTEIGYMKMKIEPLRPKYGPPQCFRCQGFFHSSRFCTRTTRCVKCAGNHLAKDCSKPIDQKPKCCLCEGEHPASFLGCPRNPRNKTEKEDSTNKKATKPVKTTFTTPAPPKPSQATSSAAPSSVESAEDLFDQLNSPAVRETFDLLEEFIKIATTIPTKSNLTVISWNANGIRSRVEEFRSFIADWNPDIVNLQETHLQPWHNFIFPDYNIYRTDGTFRGGGTAIMIKRSIPHHQIFITNNSLETTAIQLIRQNDQPVTIVSAYRPPRKSISEQDLHQIFRNQGYILVAGDLNAKHASWSPHTQQNVAGNLIRRFCDRTGYSLAAPPEPTYFHGNTRSTTIDIAICKGMTVTDCSSIPELSSDHNPVLFEVSLDDYTSPTLSIYSFPNWYKFQDILTNTLSGNPKISNPNDIENAIKNFNDCYNSALSNSSTFKCINKPILSIPLFIREKIKAKNRIRKAWQITKNPLLKSQLNRMQKEIKKDLNNHKNSKWTELLTEATPDYVILSIN
ncbi:RNA-directed DNA polymerase from mobile element jockey [Trichonephila clavipes]|nr:RNA-directed DNA polymerase from mobile element jockey [Trichonephila clavipes]